MQSNFIILNSLRKNYGKLELQKVIKAPVLPAGNVRASRYKNPSNFINFHHFTTNIGNN